MRRLAALLLAVCLAGCGGSSESASQPAAPVKLTATQQDQFIGTLKDFGDAAESFLSDLNGCGPNSACIRSTFDSFKAGADQTERAITDLQGGVRGDCATKLSDAAGKVRDATGVIRDLADAGSRGDQGEAARLARDATNIFVPITDAVQAERGACS